MQLLCNSAPDATVAKDETLAARRIARVRDICRNASGVENDALCDLDLSEAWLAMVPPLMPTVVVKLRLRQSSVKRGNWRGGLAEEMGFTDGYGCLQARRPAFGIQPVTTG